MKRKRNSIQLLKKVDSLNFNFTWHWKNVTKAAKEATKAAKEVKQKAKQACEEDMKKTWRQKPQHGGYQQRMSNGDVDKATTHQWFGSSI